MNDTILTVVGNLTDTPELRVSPNGVALTRFTVASTPWVYDAKDGSYHDGDPLFLTCMAWRDVAEHLAESLTKGTRVICTGRLTQTSWQAEDGQKRTGFVLQVEDIGPSLRFATAAVTKTSRRTADAA